MLFEKRAVNPRIAEWNRDLEAALNQAVRTVDGVRSRLHLGGRKANYDDLHYEFFGGVGDELRKKTYDKSLRLLWKAEQHTPYLSFRDNGDGERALMEMADKAMSPAERGALRHLELAEFRETLCREYSLREREAIVRILAGIGHGEAYAWLVSAELLQHVKSTGARAALTMQVMEEAKHFVVLRELLHAFGTPIPRLSVWEYMFLEGVYKADGLDKLFGMNVVVEGIAIGLFGMFSHLPGLEVLRLFHLDESRHTALPTNYLAEFPLDEDVSKGTRARLRRLWMVLPVLGLIPYIEEDLAELGIDAFEFAGAAMRKISTMAERTGFLLPLPQPVLLETLNTAFNAYCRATRPGHRFRPFHRAETTRGRAELEVERELFASS